MVIDRSNGESLDICRFGRTETHEWYGKLGRPGPITAPSCKADTDQDKAEQHYPAQQASRFEAPNPWVHSALLVTRGISRNALSTRHLPRSTDFMNATVRRPLYVRRRSCTRR